MRHLCFRIFCAVTLVSSQVWAENAGGGRGGPYLEYHSASVGAFDSGISGAPVVIGGVGFGWATKTFRLGGGGAGGFVWNGSDNLAFGLGYGGVVGEYIIAPSWLTARLMIGGGGYAVGKVTTQTDTTTTTQKINSGGFILFHPTLMVEVKIHSWVNMGASVGYFLPNVGRLQSLTFALNLLFGTVSR